MKPFLKFEHILLKEATSSFDSVIEKVIPTEKLAVSKQYKLPSGSGKFKIGKKDHEIFKRLFKENAGSKGVGNGEISLYWLFNFYKGKNNKKCFENRGDDAADLKIFGVNCEVKSYPKHTGKVGLGKFKNAYEFRELLSIIFGIDSLQQVMGKSKKGATSFNSELVFNHKSLETSLEKVQELYEIIGSNKELVKNFKIFKDLIKNIEVLYKKLGKITSGKSATDYANAMTRMLIEYKVGRKPGNNGYIVNLLKGNALDIMFHYIDFDNLNNKKKWDNFFSVGSGELQIDFSQFDKG